MLMVRHKGGALVQTCQPDDISLQDKFNKNAGDFCILGTKMMSNASLCH